MTKRTPNAETATEQELYDYVADRILEQGKGCFHVTEGRDFQGVINYRFACVYVDDNGNRCAVGQLMPKSKRFLKSGDLAECNSNGATASDGLVKKILFGPLYNKEAVSDRVEFLTGLQEAHDNSVEIDMRTGAYSAEKFMKSYAGNMLELAKEYELTPHQKLLDLYNDATA